MTNTPSMSELVRGFANGSFSASTSTFHASASSSASSVVSAAVGEPNLSEPTQTASRSSLLPVDEEAIDLPGLTTLSALIDDLIDASTYGHGDDLAHDASAGRELAILTDSRVSVSAQEVDRRLMSIGQAGAGAADLSDLALSDEEFWPSVWEAA